MSGVGVCLIMIPPAVRSGSFVKIANRFAKYYTCYTGMISTVRTEVY